LSIDETRVSEVDVPFQPAAEAVLLRRGKRNFRRVRVV
jgi:hypothetical protein